MIERLTGTVAARTGEGVVLDVGGVGFLLEVSAVTLGDVASVGGNATLFTHLHVREEALQLFGFSTEEERELFRLFLGVSKIGPRLALAALSCRRPADLKRALAAGDVALFSSVPGIGRKTAERIILELREKMGDLGVSVGSAGPGAAPLDEGTVPLARAALVELGFSVQEADRLLSTLDAGLPVEDLVRRALAR
ncbi:MAG: Holliday junction DNA helicase RuvA [Actinobacteria bacterium RBG_16_64_13]|nr:MAG: Holliday junction DNA helicase RuvA [Actinobacteria bacterium RBG_16_64_13]